MNSGFSRGVINVFVLLGCYVEWVGSCPLTFRDNLSVPRVKLPKKNAGNRWVRYYIGYRVGGDWFSGQVRESIRFLEREVAARKWKVG